MVVLGALSKLFSSIRKINAEADVLSCDFIYVAQYKMEHSCNTFHSLQCKKDT